MVKFIPTMSLPNKFIIGLLIICSCQVLSAQEAPKQDPAQMYTKIEKFSKKSKFATFIHKLIFEPVKKKPRKKSASIVKKKSYAPYDCKIIRKIKITTLDPFGYSEIDTTRKPKTWGFRAGNALHVKTKNIAIRNLLLIKKNTYLDSLLLMESERLIRSQRYVRSVLITPVSVSKDSVDINIRVLDSWSLVPNFSTSGNLTTVKLTERNFFGTGHEFANTYRKSLNNSEDAFSSSYTIPNILNTYTRVALSYQVELNGNHSKFLNIERPFYSAITRWAGGVYFDQHYIKQTYTNPDESISEEAIKYNLQDYWAGHSIQLFKGRSESIRAANLITSVRYYTKKYLETPSFEHDSLRYFSNEEMYLASVGISSRKYTQDKNVLNFNVTEDIASGVIYALTGGYRHKNGTSRLYGGARFAFGRYFDFGYLSTNIEYGSFFNKGQSEQSALTFSATYFTNILGHGRWKFRQFIKPQLVIGNNRLETYADALTLNDDNGIQGFNTTTLFGTKKAVITLQTQGYSPWNVYGFRLNPFLSYSAGMLSNKGESFEKSKLYSQVGVGLIISNDYLVFSSFQLSFSYYPDIPGVGDSLIKTNAYKTNDIGLQSFEFSRPQTVPYQ